MHRHVFFGACAAAYSVLARSFQGYRRQFDVRNETFTTFSGISAGAFVALVFALRLSDQEIDDLFDLSVSVSKTLPLLGNGYALASILLDELFRLRPNASQELSHRKLTVFYLRFPGVVCLEDRWGSNAELRRSLLKAMAIPLFSSSALLGLDGLDAGFVFGVGVPWTHLPKKVELVTFTLDVRGLYLSDLLVVPAKAPEHVRARVTTNSEGIPEETRIGCQILVHLLVWTTQTLLIVVGVIQATARNLVLRIGSNVQMSFLHSSRITCRTE